MMGRRAYTALHSPTALWLLGYMTLWACFIQGLRPIVSIQCLINWINCSVPHPKAPAQVYVSRVTRFAGYAFGFIGLGRVPNCLAISLLRYRFLVRAGYPAKLVIGFSSDSSTLEGHAWVVLQGVSVDPYDPLPIQMVETLVVMPGQRLRSSGN